MGSTFFLSVGLALAIGLTGSTALADAKPPSAAQSLRAFEGRWACAGRFEASGKPIASTIVATWDAPADALVLHQDDAPPNAFHALEIWGGDGAGGLRATISDAYSGLRWLSSPGWADDRLTWTRLQGSKPAERFVFTRPRDGSFTIEWSPVKADAFVPGDRLTCTKAAA